MKRTINFKQGKLNFRGLQNIDNKFSNSIQKFHRSCVVESATGAVIPEVGLVIKKSRRFFDIPNFKSSPQAAELFRRLFDNNTIDLQESFIVLFLDFQNRPIAYTIHSVGGTHFSVVDLKILFSTALCVMASKIMIAHNHPSGNIKPSEQDCRLTEQICKAGNLLGINVIDHLIITRFGHYSLADGGYIQNEHLQN